jgi:hypothetical protein
MLLEPPSWGAFFLGAIWEQIGIIAPNTVKIDKKFDKEPQKIAVLKHQLTVDIDEVAGSSPVPTTI